MCICTRFTCAPELTALPNNKTKPSIAIEVLRLIFSPAFCSHGSVRVRIITRSIWIPLNLGRSRIHRSLDREAIWVFNIISPIPRLARCRRTYRIILSILKNLVNPVQRQTTNASKTLSPIARPSLSGSSPVGIPHAARRSVLFFRYARLLIDALP